MLACTLGNPTSATAPSGGVFSSPGRSSIRARLLSRALTASVASAQAHARVGALRKRHTRQTRGGFEIDRSVRVPSTVPRTTPYAELTTQQRRSRRHKTGAEAKRFARRFARRLCGSYGGHNTARRVTSPPFAAPARVEKCQAGGRVRVAASLIGTRTSAMMRLRKYGMSPCVNVQSDCRAWVHACFSTQRGQVATRAGCVLANPQTSP